MATGTACRLAGELARKGHYLCLALSLSIPLPAHALLGGEEAEEGRWPFHVGLFIGAIHACGGTLVCGGAVSQGKSGEK